MKKILLFTFALCLLTSAFASDNCIPAKPSPARFVNNFSKEFPDFISTEEERTLEAKLQEFNKATSNQIVIVIVDDLCGYDANEFSTRIGQTWGVGQGKFDNGVVVMIKPTGGSGHRDAYITAGYGLEGVIPDIAAKRIVESEIIPYFKTGQNFRALDGAADVLISLAKKEFSYQDYQKTDEQGNWMPFGIFLIILIFYIYISFRRRSSTITSGGRTYYGGGWGGGFGGGGSWGGGGGGSFGGGGFGGGGAGGSW